MAAVDDKAMRQRRLLWAALGLLLAGCGGGYQAPVSEQGQQQLIRPPLIVDSSTPESSFVLPRSPAASAGSGTVLAGGAGAQRGNTHRVRAGDTLYSIAFQYDLDFRSLAIANDLDPPYTIIVGQDINLDLDRVISQQGSGGVNIGTPVENTGVARARASVSRAGGLIRRAISNATGGEQPAWQWPHHGQVLRSFQADVNKGIDIAGQVGDPVLAAGAGDVVYSGRGVQGSGNLIIIRHSDRYLSAYAHNSAMLVGEGSRVRAGDKIAELGRNPAGTAMLHFEIREDGSSVDPIGLLPGR